MKQEAPNRRQSEQSPLQALLARSRPLLLDGAVGSELSRRGVNTRLPLWSAHALLDSDGLKILTEIHQDYARAGADVLITNTFRTTVRALRRAGREKEWRQVNQRAVEAAREAAGAVRPRTCLVAGSVAPLEDCYRPDLVPPQDECLEEHRRQVELLGELGVDFLMIETMNSLREARAVLRAARQWGMEALVSLCPRPPEHLLSGESLPEVIPQLVEAGGATLQGLSLNCAPPQVLEQVYPSFAQLAEPLPHGLYAHLGEPDDVVGWKFLAHEDPRAYADWMKGRLAEGARIVGGCCGTTPEHIAALAQVLPS